MSQTYHNEEAYTGLATDTKPTEGVLPGSVFTETDTGKKLVYSGTDWFPLDRETDLRNLLQTLIQIGRRLLNEMHRLQ